MEKKRPKHERGPRKATTQEVVGDAPAHSEINPKWRGHYKNLVDLHAHLLSHKGDLIKEAIEEQPAFSLHMADAGTDSFDRDLALSLISSEQDALYEIEQALNRIKNGTYGTCELTGKRIESARLNAVPWTRFCADAERQLEKEGAVDRTRLAPREEIPKTNTTNQVARETDGSQH
jgi:RNA polymerase-binding transcription factor DksA